MTAADLYPVLIEVIYGGRACPTRVTVENFNPGRPGRGRLVEAFHIASPRRRPPEFVNRRAHALIERVPLDAADNRPTVGPVYRYASILIFSTGFFQLLPLALEG